MDYTKFHVRCHLVILVDQSCADYFKRRKIFPTQEIREVKPDGSLILSFLVGNYEEIRNIMKMATQVNIRKSNT